MNNDWCTDIDIGICPTAKQGVVIASYSGNRSRMWSWDSETLEILGFQDIKGRARLIDVSPDGIYCSYFVQAFKKSQTYLAISRPPYFHALWIADAFHCATHIAGFCPDKVVRFARREMEDAPWHHVIPDAVKPNCPFRFQEFGSEDFLPWLEVASKRCSGAFKYCGEVRRNDATPKAWFGADSQGRKYECDGSVVLIDGIPFLDCKREEFRAITPPEWATEW